MNENQGKIEKQFGEMIYRASLDSRICFALPKSIPRLRMEKTK